MAAALHSPLIPSVIELKLLGVDQSPDNILKSPPRIFGVTLEVADGDFQFICSGFT
jgi:hypothetical protein